MAKEYPLEQLVIIKKKKLEEAERILREKKDKLDEEIEKLKKIEAERDKAKQHKQDKLIQLREALDEGIRTDKIEEMRSYLKIVEEKLKQHQKRVETQEKEVTKAEEEVDRARKEVLKRQRDVEKLREHHGEWTEEMRKELEKEEASQADEMGASRYIREKRKKKRNQ